MFNSSRKVRMPAAHEALPGRAQAMSVPARHYVNDNTLLPPYPAGMQLAVFSNMD